MKLYILRPKEDAGAWEPWYDKAFGFVVRASTPKEARRVAAENGGDENPRRWNVPDDTTRLSMSPWNDPKQSTCRVLRSNGKLGLVIQDFASA